MKCDLCRALMAAGNIGYVSVVKRGKNTFLCKRCHRKRKERERKTNNSWIVI